MKLPFGFQITRREKALSPIYENRGTGWLPMIRESFTGAWQRNIVIDTATVLAYNAVFACITLISSDIAKLRLKLVEKDDNGIWKEVESNAFSPVIRKPNRYQNRIQFYETWMLSKLLTGNTYVLKGRDDRKVVTSLFILDPHRVKVLVADDGSVFYQLARDNLSGLGEEVIIPESEIIHDRFNTFYHPLVGKSPIFAAGNPAMRGYNIQASSEKFFANRLMPGGVLSSDAPITQATADRIKAEWEANFSGDNFGRVAIAGDGLKYTPITMSAADSQLIEQQQWTAQEVCSCFHVPPYKIGVVPPPANANVQALNIEYYEQCLQILIESTELCLDEGLGIGVPKDGKTLGTEFDLDGLLRMDSQTQMETLEKGMKAGVLTPNESRKRLDLPPTKGGESPYLQQQNYSLAALAKRDTKEDPFKRESEAPPPAAAGDAPANDNDDELQAARALVEIQRGLR